MAEKTLTAEEAHKMADSRMVPMYNEEMKKALNDIEYQAKRCRYKTSVSIRNKAHRKYVIGQLKLLGYKVRHSLIDDEVIIVKW